MSNTTRVLTAATVALTLIPLGATSAAAVAGSTPGCVWTGHLRYTTTMWERPGGNHMGPVRIGERLTFRNDRSNITPHYYRVRITRTKALGWVGRGAVHLIPC